VEFDVSDAPDLATAAGRCCAHLADLGFELPSLYLRRSGRLRCFASHGYWQVLDGFPESSGVIAETVRTGVPLHVTTDSDLYLEAAPGVLAEVCVPILVNGIAIGAINVESAQHLPESTIGTLTAIAATFAARVTDLGGMPEPEGWRRLADQAPALTAKRDEPAIVDLCLDVLSTLSGAAAAIVVVRDEAGDHRVAGSAGPLGPVVGAIDQSSLASMAEWVAGALSCYTAGEPDGIGFTQGDTLRTLGLQSLVVASLSSGDQRLGFLALADQCAATPDRELVEQIELWAALTASALLTARAIRSLETLSTSDSLTGLPHQTPFKERLATTGDRADVALLVIDVDHFKAVNDTRGHRAGDDLLTAIAHEISGAVRQTDVVYRIGGDEFAVLLEPVRDQETVVEIADRIVRNVRAHGASVSIGISLDTSGGDLFEHADGALYAAKALGRNRYQFAESARSHDAGDR